MMTLKIYLVLTELVDGQTTDGEHFIVIGAYCDHDAPERRAEAERAGGNWGRFTPDADWSDAGWYVTVEPIDLIA